MKIRIIIFFALIIILSLFGYFWFNEATSAPSPQEAEIVTFVIEPGQGVRDITSDLHDDGLIRDPLAFFILVKLKGVETAIQAGEFTLSSAMSAEEVLDELQHGTMDVEVTIPEGWRNEEIALQLAGDLEIPEQDFLQYAEEGYMFPDTYHFPLQASASDAAQTMRDNFQAKVLSVIEQDLEASEYSLDEIITIASMIEREALHDEDRPIIASVIYNRLDEGMGLNIDATLQYALGYQSAEKDWWKEGLTNQDKEVESPYNTYLYQGLPPGPIANPGLESIRAALNPANTDYLYYISAPDGINHYARTLDEHNDNVNRYLR